MVLQAGISMLGGSGAAAGAGGAAAAAGPIGIAALLAALGIGYGTSPTVRKKVNGMVHDGWESFTNPYQHYNDPDYVPKNAMEALSPPQMMKNMNGLSSVFSPDGGDNALLSGTMSDTATDKAENPKVKMLKDLAKILNQKREAKKDRDGRSQAAWLGAGVDTVNPIPFTPINYGPPTSLYSSRGYR